MVKNESRSVPKIGAPIIRPQAVVAFPLRVTPFGPRFLDPEVELAAQEALSAICLDAVRQFSRINIAVCLVLLIALLTFLTRAELLSFTPIVVSSLLMSVCLLHWLNRARQSGYRGAVLGYACIHFVMTTVLWPYVCLAVQGIDLLMVLGYFGPIMGMLVCLLIRLPFSTSLVMCAATVAVYMVVLLQIDGASRFMLVHCFTLSTTAVGCISGAWMFEYMARVNFAQTRIIALREDALALEHARAEKLLLNILPRDIATRLTAGESPIADRIESVTVVFADLVGFTALAATLEPNEVVTLLDAVSRRFDACARTCGVEKIKTIGDAYLAVAGLSGANPNHAIDAAKFAITIRAALAGLKQELGVPLALRIGIESGPVVAGVIGNDKFSYDLWGDTVNTAARLESHGEQSRIQVGDHAAGLLRSAFQLEERGMVELKGKGAQRTWWLGDIATPIDSPT